VRSPCFADRAERANCVPGTAKLKNVAFDLLEKKSLRSLGRVARYASHVFSLLFVVSCFHRLGRQIGPNRREFSRIQLLIKPRQFCDFHIVPMFH
jgi:hypothetical protein